MPAPLIPPAPRHCRCRLFLLLAIAVLFSGCAVDPGQTVLYLAPVPSGEEAVHAPAFLVKDAEQAYNRIGTPLVREKQDGSLEVVVDPEKASIYYETARFTTPRGGYRNLIYRIHFSEVPFALTSPNLTAGKNPGILIIYTLDALDRLLLVTTVHTCGCYLAFLPTTNLDRTAFPLNWPREGQSVYGYRLPALLQAPETAGQRLTFVIESESHRIGGVQLLDAAVDSGLPIHLAPLGNLHRLPHAGGEYSFFETEGPRTGYVRNNRKLLERLLIGWWAFDWRVGEDKAFGHDDDSQVVFYTSLKFWAREESNLKNFPAFLNYWGWRL